MDNNIFLKTYSRIYQKILFVASNFLHWKIPQTIKGENSLASLAEVIKNKNFKKPMIVTDSFLDNIKIYEPLTNELEKLNIPYEIFNQVIPNPTVDNVNQLLNNFKSFNCDMFVAIGGGSCMDCAKACGALLVKPTKQLKDLKGILKVRKEIPTLICVPTTAGTGSEVTVAAVISDPKNNTKYAINDLVLTPKIAVLDPLLIVNLPKGMTATTGMDTLTHSIEAYIGKSNTKKTREYAKKSIKLLFDNLEKSYIDGSNLIVRQNMQESAFYGGLAFTRAYVGTVHALAHSLGGVYNVPHGLANAILLPVTLKAYGKSIYKPLSQLAELIGVSGINKKEKAEKFIQKIEDMNKNMGIPNKLSSDYQIKENDLDYLVEHSFKEINPLYPVPKILSKKELKEIYKSVI
ncbi:MAG: iron-containing alcohol dehydrogenase [Clostridia bacterium]|nr:iron-containing alcohol dehydrogenase [Clostridia bacterium]